MLRQLTFRAVEFSPEAPRWREDESRVVYDLEGLTARCLALITEQVHADDPTSSAVSTSPPDETEPV